MEQDQLMLEKIYFLSINLVEILQRITNWDAFDDLEDEHDAKVDQMVRIIQYLKTLPVKTVTLPKVEADDIIAYIS